MAVMREGAQILHAHVHHAGLPRAAHNSVLQRPGKKFGEDGYDVQAHHGEDYNKWCATS
jgi:hypothetical protein